jgi:hypothetical protein
VRTAYERIFFAGQFAASIVSDSGEIEELSEEFGKREYEDSNGKKLLEVAHLPLARCTGDGPTRQLEEVRPQGCYGIGVPFDDGAAKAATTPRIRGDAFFSTV